MLDLLLFSLIVNVTSLVTIVVASIADNYPAPRMHARMQRGKVIGCVCHVSYIMSVQCKCDPFWENPPKRGKINYSS